MSVLTPEPPKRYFEDVLEQTGWGLYYKFLLGFTVINACINAIATMSMSFILPLSSCNSLLTKNDIIITHVFLALGKGIGGLILSSVADNNGKRCMIPKTSIVIFGSCFVIAFSHNSYTLYLAGFILGSGIQTNSTIVKIYFAEILPKLHRGFYLVLVDVFWAVGCLIVAVFAYFMLHTQPIDGGDIDVRLTIWRGVFAIIGGLNLAIACTSALLEMGPRFLLFKGRIISAAIILKQFYAINRSKYSETCEIDNQDLFNLINNYDINREPEPNGLCAQINMTVIIFLRMIRLIVSKRFLPITVYLTLLHIILMFKTVGMSIMLSKEVFFLNQTTVEGYELLHINAFKVSSCNLDFENKIYQNFILLTIHMIFSLALLLFAIDVVGRRISIFAGLWICGLGTLVIANFHENFIICVVAAALTIFGFIVTESTVFIVTIESFPTAVRATAVTIVSCLGNILVAFMYLFLSTRSYTFFTILGVFLLGASLLAWGFPELKKQPMVE